MRLVRSCNQPHRTGVCGGGGGGGGGASVVMEGGNRVKHTPMFFHVQCLLGVMMV